MFDTLLDALEEELHTALQAAVTGFVATARARLEIAVVGLAEERTKGLAEVDASRIELRREVEAMHTHKEAHEGHVELNIGGYRFQTSVQTLRRVPHTFFDAYFSGRYAQDVCSDGSIFVDRDGEHFSHVLEYMRDGTVSVAAPGARPRASLLRVLKREFGFYCIELCAEQTARPAVQREFAYVMVGDGHDEDSALSRMEKYDASSGKWSVVAALSTPRNQFGMSVLGAEIYISGGVNSDQNTISSVEKYSPSSDTWSTVAPLPELRSGHAAVTVGSAMYLIGGRVGDSGEETSSVLKFDAMHGTWSEVASMPEARWASAACAIGNDIYVFGGIQVSRVTFTRRQSSVFKYDTVADEWRILARMPRAGAYQSACVHGDHGLVYIINTGRIFPALSFVSFNPMSGAWLDLAPPSHRSGEGCSFFIDNNLYSLGTFDDHSSVDRYDGPSNTWTTVANMREIRYS
jgi:hypothetical protein